MDLACKAFVPIDSSITSGLIEQGYAGNKDEDNEKKISLVNIHDNSEKILILDILA